MPKTEQIEQKYQKVGIDLLLICPYLCSVKKVLLE
jgi:hypothetical protein